MGSDNGGNLPEQASIEIHVCGSNRFYGSKMTQKIAGVLTSRCFFPMKTTINTSHYKKNTTQLGGSSQLESSSQVTMEIVSPQFLGFFHFRMAINWVDSPSTT